jgi:hypothetical protein
MPHGGTGILGGGVGGKPRHVSGSIAIAFPRSPLRERFRADAMFAREWPRAPPMRPFAGRSEPPTECTRLCENLAYRQKAQSEYAPRVTLGITPCNLRSPKNMKCKVCRPIRPHNCRMAETFNGTLSRTARFGLPLSYGELKLKRIVIFGSGFSIPHPDVLATRLSSCIPPSSAKHASVNEVWCQGRTISKALAKPGV